MEMDLKKCPSCGKELPLESKFCPYCMELMGEPVAVSVPADKKVNKKLVAIVILIFVILLICVIMFFAHYNKEEKDNNTDNGVLTEEANDVIDVDSMGNNITDENNVDVTSDVNANSNEPKTESGVTKEESKITSTYSSSTSTTKWEKETINNVVTQCAHNWVNQTKIVQHEEVGHYETVQKQRPITQYKCPVCYKKYESVNEYYNHFDSTHKPGYSGDPIGALRNHYTTVTEYEYYDVQEWIVDREAYEETVVTGYKCKICGKEKGV